MITSVQSDFSVMPRCNGDEIGLFEILDKLILSTGSDSIGEDGNRQQCLAVYHHREVKCRILGSIPSYAYDNFCEMYNAYHKLGGNGMITKMMHEIEELHLREKGE